MKRTQEEKEKLKFEKLKAKYGYRSLDKVVENLPIAKLWYHEYLQYRRMTSWDRISALVAYTIAVGFIVSTFFCGIVMMIPGLAFSMLGTECALSNRINSIRADMVAMDMITSASIDELHKKKGTKKCSKK